MVQTYQVVPQHQQADLGFRAFQATTGKAADLAMLLEIGVYQFHCLPAQAIQRLGVVRSHPLPQLLDQILVLAAANGAARLRIWSALHPQRTLAAVLGWAAVLVELHRLDA